MIQFIIFYLVGCILSYGKFMGAWYELQEDHILLERVSRFGLLQWLLISMSWVSFLSCLAVVYIGGEYNKYLFKWSLKPLLEEEKHIRKEVDDMIRYYRGE